MALPVLWCQVEPVARRLVGLAGVGLGLLTGYILLARLYPLGPSLAETRGAWTRLVEPAWQNAALHIAIYLGLALLYITALRLLNQPPPVDPAPSTPLNAGQRLQIGMIYIIWIACSGVVMTIAPAGESRDIFDYLFRGRMIAEYGANPLAEIPKSYSTVPYYRYLAWHSHVDTYGPLWEIASAGVSVAVREAADLFSPDSTAAPSCPKSPASCHLLAAYITGYRLLAVVLVGLSSFLVASMVKRSQPGLVPAALAAWLWCPLTIIAAVLGGHNDSFMLVLVLLGMWLLQRKLPFWALLALVLAAHIKLTALIWLPVFAVWIVHRWGWPRAVWLGLSGAAVGLGISFLLYAPFAGWGTLPRMLHERSLYLANSAWLALNLFLNKQLGWSKEIVRRLTIDLPTVLFAASSVLVSIRLLDVRPNRLQNPAVSEGDADRRLWTSLLTISLLYLIIGSFWFQHWYVLWVLAPAALLPASLFTRYVLPWLSFGALSANVLADFLPAAAPGLFSPPLFALAIFGLIWLPGLTAAGICASKRRRSSRELPLLPQNGLTSP